MWGACNFPQDYGMLKPCGLWGVQAAHMGRLYVRPEAEGVDFRIFRVGKGEERNVILWKNSLWRWNKENGREWRARERW